MFLQEPDTGHNEYHRPEPRDTRHIEHVQIREEIDTANHNKGNAAPELTVSHIPELLPHAVDRCFQLDTLF